jgi:23S rRNA (uracil1939-C5)-methyltransferase
LKKIAIMGRRKKKPLPLFQEIRILDLAAEGKAIAKHDDMVVFVKNAVPGDVVDIQITRKRRRYMEGIVKKFHRYSEDRAQPFCGHFGVCGGCKWQNLPYEKQLHYKHQQVADQLGRIGGIPDLILKDMRPILGSGKTRHYRNKLEFTFSDNRWLTEEEMNSDSEKEDLNALGFHIPGRFDKVLALDHCYLQPEPSDKIRNWFRSYTREHRLSHFNLKVHRGLMRNLIIRNTLSGEFMVIVVFYEDLETERTRLLDGFRNAFPEVQSLMYVVNQKANDTIQDQEVLLYHGRPYIIEKIEHLEFRIGPKSFFQTNSEQACRLYQVVREFADLSGKEKVWDWYTGTGTIANFLAVKSKYILGIESVPEAIDDAIINTRENRIDNVDYLVADMKDIHIPQLIQKYGQPDVVVMDPPRAGVHPRVIEHILLAAPERMVYVSCNPATQARDISLLLGNYQVADIQPVDMFPHTHHVENVVLLRRREPSAAL